MANEVIGADEGFIGDGRSAFCEVDSYHERAGETRAVRDGDGVEFVPLEVGVFEGCARNVRDVADVLAGGDFGDDAAISRVDVGLAGDYV